MTASLPLRKNSHTIQHIYSYTHADVHTYSDTHRKVHTCCYTQREVHTLTHREVHAHPDTQRGKHLPDTLLLLANLLIAFAGFLSFPSSHLSPLQSCEPDSRALSPHSFLSRAEPRQRPSPFFFLLPFIYFFTLPAILPEGLR